MIKSSKPNQNRQTSILVPDLPIGISRQAAIEPVYEPPRKGDVLHSLASVDAAAEALGLTENVSVGEGIRLTVDWYRERAGAGDPAR